ncbi:MAG: hypothetical protein IJB45_04990 [Clostridia bacterium]|nr:hypothetical protein [Clostridia bacterium]
MFVVLRIINAEENRIKRKQRKIIAASQVVPHSTDKGLPFFTLDVLEDKKGINWAAVCEKCGRYSSRIIAPRTVTLPEINNLRRFVSRSTVSSLIFNTAVRYIEKAKLPPDKISITLTDRYAVMASRVCRLLPFASLVRVITTRPERYASACVKAMEDFGATLIIRPSYEPLSGCDIVICCDSVVTPAMENAVIFTDERKSGGKIRFCGSGLELLPVHKEIIPENISSVDFAGALFELCGCLSYCNSFFSQIGISCSRCESRCVPDCLACACDVTKWLQIN